MRTLAPSSIATSTVILGAIEGLAPFALPLLVLPPFNLSFPLCPLLVSSTPLASVAVFSVFVNAVVEYVCVAMGSEPAAAWSFIITSAKPGAGTLMGHVPAVWSHWTVTMLSVPMSRPSELNLSPKVWFAHVMLNSWLTEFASRYLCSSIISVTTRAHLPACTHLTFTDAGVLPGWPVSPPPTAIDAVYAMLPVGSVM